MTIYSCRRQNEPNFSQFYQWLEKLLDSGGDRKARFGAQPVRAHFDPRAHSKAYSHNRRAAIDNIVDANPVPALVRGRASFAWRLPSFDHLVGAGEHGRRNVKAERLRGLQINH
jgi:hypothetical protein